MKRDEIAIDVRSNSSCSTHLSELDFDHMLDNDVMECIRVNNHDSSFDDKDYIRVLDTDPTPISELHK